MFVTRKGNNNQGDHMEESNLNPLLNQLEEKGIKDLHSILIQAHQLMLKTNELVSLPYQYSMSLFEEGIKQLTENIKEEEKEETIRYKVCNLFRVEILNNLKVNGVVIGHQVLLADLVRFTEGYLHLVMIPQFLFYPPTNTDRIQETYRLLTNPKDKDIETSLLEGIKYLTGTSVDDIKLNGLLLDSNKYNRLHTSIQKALSEIP